MFRSQVKPILMLNESFTEFQALIGLGVVSFDMYVPEMADVVTLTWDRDLCGFVVSETFEVSLELKRLYPKRFVFV